MRSRISTSLLLLVGLGMASVSAQAQNNPLIALDENGKGTITFPGGAAIPLPGVLTADPGPGGLASALTYNLGGPPSLVAGDLLLSDVAGGPTSDIVRFNPAGTALGYPASAVFYSLDNGGSLADTGAPGALYTNTFTALEGMDYTPTANQPGFVSGFSVTYHIMSDTTAVPEPGSVALLVGMGLSGAGFLARRRKNARHAA